MLRFRYGFSLLEVVISIALLAVLTALAMPYYTNYLIQQDRTSVQLQLIEAAQYIQGYYQSYHQFPTELPVELQSFQGSKLNYQIDYTSDNLQVSFKLIASANPKDKQCGKLVLNQLGEKTLQDVVTLDSATIQQCWNTLL